MTVGAVAQLVERSVRIAEVRGSTPLGSTKFFTTKRRNIMPKHTVKMEIPSTEIKSPVQFSVQQNGKKLGTLKVSTGGLTWLPKGKSKDIPIAWDSFAPFMEKYYGVGAVRKYVNWTDLATAVKRKP